VDAGHRWRVATSGHRWVSTLPPVSSFPSPPPTECLGWRQTSGCSSYGTREAHNDAPCTQSIISGRSGYCQCADDVVASRVDCVHSEFTCALACGAANKARAAAEAAAKKAAAERATADKQAKEQAAAKAKADAATEKEKAAAKDAIDKAAAAQKAALEKQASDEKAKAAKAEADKAKSGAASEKAAAAKAAADAAAAEKLAKEQASEVAKAEKAAAKERGAAEAAAKKVVAEKAAADRQAKEKAQADAMAAAAVKKEKDAADKAALTIGRTCYCFDCGGVKERRTGICGLQGNLLPGRIACSRVPNQGCYSSFSDKPSDSDLGCERCDCALRICKAPEPSLPPPSSLAADRSLQREGVILFFGLLAFGLYLGHLALGAIIQGFKWLVLWKVRLSKKLCHLKLEHARRERKNVDDEVQRAKAKLGWIDRWGPWTDTPGQRDLQQHRRTLGAYDTKIKALEAELGDFERWFAEEGLHTENAVRAFFARRQRDSQGGPQLRVSNVVKVENAQTLSTFHSSGNFYINPFEAFQKGGDTLLFHGLPQEAATNVQATGLLLSYAANGMLGRGLYGAPDPRKSLQYCRSANKFMFICRYNLASPARHAGPGMQHRNSIFDEFCVYDEQRVVILWMLKLE